MVIDEADAVTEVSETNNSDRLKYVGTGGAPVTGGVTNQGRAELSVRAIRVNGSGSGSQDNCKAGKNDIAVVVKNSGTAKVDDFVLRLAVDDDNGQAREQQVSALEADQEREVRFDDVRLKKGERHLTAITDAEQSVDEAQENNNDFLVSVRCESE
jgi:subtilase family serine protease